MEDFDPITKIENCASILHDGAWPSFHDAIVYSLNLWRGDIRPDDNVWVAPRIDACFELAALEFPYVIDLRFHDCCDIHLASFDDNNDIYWLSFSLEHRGYYTDGVTPLPPYVCVRFEGGPGQEPMLEFKCFSIEAIGRRDVPPPPCR